MNKESELRLLLKCSILEHELRINKGNYYLNCKIEAENGLALLPNTKEFKVLRNELKDSIDLFKKRLYRSEKYNSEILDLFLKHGGDKKQLYESIIDKSTDLYDDLTQLFLNALNDVETNETKKLRVALLEESENGTIFIDKKYLIHTR